MTTGDGTKTVTSELDHRTSQPARAEILVVLVAHRPACDARYPKQHDPVRVGRKKVCDLALDDGELSGDHFAIVHLGGNAWRVTDYGSKNFTYVNGTMLNGASVELDDGPVVVRAGGTVMVLGSFDGLLRIPIAMGPFIKGTALTTCHNHIANYATAKLPILIQGETGSGKEEAARVAHRHGRNKKGPFVAANCSAITESLAESELFGVKKGAITGVAESPGLFGEADGGTLFLDEIHNLPPELQPKLLRTLQDGTLRVVGGSERKVDVQLVCATNLDLREEVAAGDFGEDLFMRIAGAIVDVPPLRRRADELPFLIALEAGDMPVHADFVEECYLRPWPGNVRELRAATKAAVVSARASGSARVRAGDLPRHAGIAIGAQGRAGSASSPPTTSSRDEARRATLFEQHRRHGDVDLAAKTAGVSRATAYRWLKAAGLV